MIPKCKIYREIYKLSQFILLLTSVRMTIRENENHNTQLRKNSIQFITNNIVVFIYDKDDFSLCILCCIFIFYFTALSTFVVNKHYNIPIVQQMLKKVHYLMVHSGYYQYVWSPLVSHLCSWQLLRQITIEQHQTVFDLTSNRSFVTSRSWRAELHQTVRYAEKCISSR